MWKTLLANLIYLVITVADNIEKPRLLQGESSSVYNFPFVCSYHYTPDEKTSIVLGTCTIYTLGTVLFSVDTLDRLMSTKSTPWVSKVPQISVIAGSDVLDPEEPTKMNYVQVRKVKSFKVGMKENMTRNPTIADDPGIFTDMFDRNALGEIACDIGIFILDKGWEWSPLVLPIPLATLNYDTMVDKAREWYARLEYWPWLYDTCSVGGWGPTGNNDLQVHELVYVPRFECMEALCIHHGDTCLYYPLEDHHVCFKARKYGDVCVYDQGSPVYCPWFGRAIFAVLTRSFDCGLENIPGVYAIISYVTTFARYALDDQTIEARPDFNDPKYTLKNDVAPSTTTRKPTTKRKTRRTPKRRYPDPPLY